MLIQTYYDLSAYDHRSAGFRAPAFGSDPRSDDAPLDLKSARIFVVEDEALLGMELQSELQALGARVAGPVLRLEAALDEAKHADIDAAILDVDLQGRDVFPVADILEARGVPFLFHTGHGEQSVLQELYPNVPVCSKPISLCVLFDILCDLI